LDSLTLVIVRSCGQPSYCVPVCRGIVSSPSRPKTRRGVSFRARRPGQWRCAVLESSARMLGGGGAGSSAELWGAMLLGHSRKGASVTELRPAIPLLALDGCLVHQHDGNIVFHRIRPVALPALQAFRVFAVLEGLLARGTDQNIQQVFGNHDKGIVRQREWSVVSGRWSVRSPRVRSFPSGAFKMFPTSGQNRRLTIGH
jgi:hypothetical protein